MSFTIGPALGHAAADRRAPDVQQVLTTACTLQRRAIRMKVNVRTSRARSEPRVVELDDGAAVEQLMRELGFLPDGWIAVRGGEPVPIDLELADGDDIELISVVSGG